MLSDVEEKITSVDIDPLTGLETPKVKRKCIVNTTIDSKEESLIDILERRSGYCGVTNSSIGLK